jgi:hypothetical protein
MIDRATLLNSIASTIQTYRQGDIPTPNSAHVDRWVGQFPLDQQHGILEEMAPLLQQCFLTRQWISNEMRDLVLSQAVAGPNPALFWPKVNFLRVQHNGNSQRDMLEIFGEQLQVTYGIDVNQCGNAAGDYMYLDDIMCTGSRVGADLETWICDHAPAKATLHVVGLITHTGGTYYLESIRLKAAVERSGKSIDLKFWYSISVENQKRYRNVSEVLWPVALPQEPEMQAYFDGQRFPFEPRTPLPMPQPSIFSTEQGRQMLENAFLVAGMKIRSQQANPSVVLKPLGFSNFGIGFGSTYATYRNCPNTAPLAIWWGEGREYGAMQWYPLLPRITY